MSLILSTLCRTHAERKPPEGFLPIESPLTASLNRYYEPWETITANLPSLISSRVLRDSVDCMPILSVLHLQAEPEWRRAYVLLTFMLHGYIWGCPNPVEIIPPPLAIPLLQVSAHVELPPIATFAGLCLWNYKVIDADRSPADPENLGTGFTFTGTDDEKWFYLISVAIEADGARVVSLMTDLITASQRQDRLAVTKGLDLLSKAISHVRSLLQRMYERCDPHVFYHHLRPFLNGTKNAAHAGLPFGILYNDGTGLQEYTQYRGGSNAQSSLIQLFDIILGIEHSSDERAFLLEMRQYMPGPHRRFLERIPPHANMREFVRNNPCGEELNAAYARAVCMLRSLRNAHLRIVSRYIIVESKKTTPILCSICNSRTHTTNPLEFSKDLSVDCSRQDDSRKRGAALRGTGGTPLVQFLKRLRDDTNYY
ncbi:indoleamine 2,3-dioxygenase [Aspergillus pseudonomiae]|uniref:Indoleamine 2,3-dioxygenase n=1 Tax=Aspergillus pseudonomiae TaxID=1506151 RepID=A0A5N6IFQ4_9EURO|nr:indoleamine 2,3-dioxygenase [Aspergillus pseudonomiae]KAB8265375.1 indoleamine 2,3-dioxygenase [Aspergillus pseudonomiae]KAE8402422.1 indoleamine 2,3-dioxygenase [Aspergillus pseudonomiae]